MELESKRSITDVEHYTWGNHCDGWHLLVSDGLSVIQERMPPDTSEEMHYHVKAQQLFYVLSGDATFIVDGRQSLISANESIHIPAGLIHKILNRGEHDLNFIVISEPKSKGDRVNV